MFPGYGQGDLIELKILSKIYNYIIESNFVFGSYFYARMETEMLTARVMGLLGLKDSGE